jgi:hypothetical protein
MKTLIASLFALAAVTATVIPASAGFGPKDLPTQDTAPGFGPKDLPIQDTAPGFGPKDLPIQDTAPGFGPKSAQTADGPGL